MSISFTTATEYEYLIITSEELYQAAEIIAHLHNNEVNSELQLSTGIIFTSQILNYILIGI